MSLPKTVFLCSSGNYVNTLHWPLTCKLYDVEYTTHRIRKVYAVFCTSYYVIHCADIQLAKHKLAATKTAADASLVELLP